MEFITGLGDTNDTRFDDGSISFGTSAGGNPEYYVEDFLGTSRIVTTSTGSVCYDADFYPYGGERTPYTNNCPSSNVYKFEGKERDAETGNDDFGARYYSNRFGRWLSADWSSTPVAVPYANLTNPQTLNLYAMVSDDPETSADLDGHECCDFWQVVNFLGAAVNAWASDNLAGAGRVDQTSTEGKLGAAGGDLVATIQGGEEFTAGGSGVVGGVALSATGEGALVGVPLAVVSAPVAAHGAVVATEGAGHLATDVADAIHDAINAPVENRGGENAAAAAGRQQHQEFKEKVQQKPGWQSEPSLTDPATGKTVKPDAVTPSGRPVELKPATPSGARAGRAAMKKYQRATGKKGRVVYYGGKKPTQQ